MCILKHRLQHFICRRRSVFNKPGCTIYKQSA